ncbi:hypothetical protein N752_26155 [Desulforamulus aquiferis]|nr:radical SAM protein [Desulforamulus aquiferis]RYD02192.1 hypothetical protein N752_26155 [Desulforamulus aquiferis]
MIIDHGNGLVFRPPAEANSLILRITIGCSHNACAFCAMYRRTKFLVRTDDEIFHSIELAAEKYPDTRRVFLADGNALVLSTEQLLSIISKLKSTFPKLTRVACYGGPRDILRKTVNELTVLREAGLKIVYLGIESGDDGVLIRVNKGVNSMEMVAAGQRVLKSGIKLSAMVILGLGGNEKSAQHALNTARVLNLINPTILSTLTLTLYEGTPLWESVQKGEFIPPSKEETLLELRQLLSNIQFSRPCIFRSDHASNLLPYRAH